MQDLITIGHTKKTYGYQGALKIFVEDHFLDEFLEAEVVFLEIKGQQIPYFIKNIENEHQLLLELEDVDTKEAAKQLTDKPISMRREDLAGAPEAPVDELLILQQFIGFTIVDQEAGMVGVVEDIIEMPQQYFALVRYKGAEALIPINDEFLVGADLEEKILEMDLPEGLLDLFGE
jgi:16S rRNA processing protein RimM